MWQISPDTNANHSLHPATRVIWDPIILTHPQRLTDVQSWHGHLPFARWIVSAIRPRILVELGTHKGDSYCMFCQTVKFLVLPTRCFAVDTWCGDTQSGGYSEDVYKDLQQHNDAHYKGFSTLLRGTFDDTLAKIDDRSVDLLHIDGFHSYQAVRHDFESWRSKLSNRGVVLFHDCTVVEPGFGVWRFWAELCRQFPHFTFHHSNGLGIAAVGKEIPAGLQPLLNMSPDDGENVRHLFENIAAGSGICANDIPTPDILLSSELLDAFLFDMQKNKCLVPVRSYRQQKFRYTKRMVEQFRSRITHAVKGRIVDLITKR